MWPSGSRKYIAAAGIHPITLGSSAGSPKKRERLDSLSTQALRSGEHVTSATFKGDLQLHADRCRADRHKPSIARPGRPIQ
jgi:hypothetical protein